jgi:hypothetical protein
MDGGEVSKRANKKMRRLAHGDLHIRSPKFKGPSEQEKRDSGVALDLLWEAEEKRKRKAAKLKKQLKDG